MPSCLDGIWPFYSEHLAGSQRICGSKSANGAVAVTLGPLFRNVAMMCRQRVASSRDLVRFRCLYGSKRERDVLREWLHISTLVSLYLGRYSGELQEA
jgi:hypothetical protein